MSKGWADIHMVKAFLDALVLMIEESRKFIDKSRTKQRERPKGCIIYSPHCLRMPKTFVGREGILYTYIGVGAFSVVRFRLVGQCESLSIMKRATEWLYAFFVCINLLVKSIKVCNRAIAIN